MSHDHGWRAACLVTIRLLGFHSKIREIARGVTAMVVGSGALLASSLLFFVDNTGANELLSKVGDFEAELGYVDGLSLDLP